MSNIIIVVQVGIYNCVFLHITWNLEYSPEPASKEKWACIQAIDFLILCIGWSMNIML